MELVPKTKQKSYWLQDWLALEFFIHFSTPGVNQPLDPNIYSIIEAVEFQGTFECPSRCLAFLVIVHKEPEH